MRNIRSSAYQRVRRRSPIQFSFSSILLGFLLLPSLSCIGGASQSPADDLVGLFCEHGGPFGSGFGFRVSRSGLAESYDFSGTILGRVWLTRGQLDVFEAIAANPELVQSVRELKRLHLETCCDRATFSIAIGNIDGEFAIDDVTSSGRFPTVATEGLPEIRARLRPIIQDLQREARLVFKSRFKASCLP